MTRLQHAQRISQDLDGGIAASLNPGEPIRLRFGHPYRDPVDPRWAERGPRDDVPGPNPFAPPPLVCEWTGEPVERPREWHPPSVTPRKPVPTRLAVCWLCGHAVPPSSVKVVGGQVLCRDPYACGDRLITAPPEWLRERP